MALEFEALANMLSAAERAGGKALTEMLDLAGSPELRELLRKVAHDEGYWARELGAAVRRQGGTPSTEVGDFADKVRAVPDLAGKLALLNRGQRWVVRKIEEHLPEVADPAVRGLLAAMAAAHVANIAMVDTSDRVGGSRAGCSTAAAARKAPDDLSAARRARRRRRLEHHQRSRSAAAALCVEKAGTGAFEFTYREAGPHVWRIDIRKVGAGALPATGIEYGPMVLPPEYPLRVLLVDRRGRRRRRLRRGRTLARLRHRCLARRRERGAIRRVRRDRVEQQIHPVESDADEIDHCRLDVPPVRARRS